MQVNMMKNRYQIGLEKLLTAEADVNVMKTELIELQPKLIETGKEVEATLKVFLCLVFAYDWIIIHTAPTSEPLCHMVTLRWMVRTAGCCN